MHLTEQHEKAIDTLLQEFKKNLQRVQQQYEASKRESDQLKMNNEEKLTMQEEEQNDEIARYGQKRSTEINQLEAVINELKNDMETLRWQKERLEKEK